MHVQPFLNAEETLRAVIDLYRRLQSKRRICKYLKRQLEDERQLRKAAERSAAALNDGIWKLQRDIEIARDVIGQMGERIRDLEADR